MCRFVALLLVAVVSLVGCSADDSAEDSDAPASMSGSGDTGGQRFPDVVEATLEPTGEGTYDVEVTLSSPYDSPERYADGWRVLEPDDTVLGEHELTHDHAAEQPFTRVQVGLEIPADVERVTVEGRDLANGYGGRTATVDVP